MSHDITCFDRNEPKEIVSSTKFHAVQCWTDEGSTWTTSVNPRCSEKEILDYFLGQYFNVAPFPNEKLEMVTAVKIQFAPKDEPVRSKSMGKRLKVLRGETL